MASSDQAGMDSSKLDASYLKKLDMSTEELGRFEKAMADPKFVQLLSEYSKEMEDPKLREENEQYLRQLEREGQGGAGYGKDTELVAPHTGFCVKTKNKKTGAKAFINICHSDKIAAATSTVRSDGSGSDWSIPYSLSTARTEKDKAGKECEAHDFVISSTTFERCQSDRRFKTFVVETALDSVEAQRQCHLDRSFTLPKLKFKGPGDSPPVLAVKTSKKAIDESTPNDSPMSPLQPSKQLNSARSAFTFGRGATKGPVRKAPATAKSAGAQPIEGDPSLLELERAEECCDEADTEAPDLVEEASGADTRIIEIAPTSTQRAGLETQPKFDIVQQGVMDLSSFWLDERAEAPRMSRPESLLFRVELPLLASAAAVELDVSEQRVVLRSSGKYHLDIPLPYPVEESKGRAKFDKVRRRLEIVLPVVRPPMPPRKPFEEPSPEEGDDTTGDAPPATCEAVTGVPDSPQTAKNDAPERHVSDPSGEDNTEMSNPGAAAGAFSVQSVVNTANTDSFCEVDPTLSPVAELVEPMEEEESDELEAADQQVFPSIDTHTNVEPQDHSRECAGVNSGQAGLAGELPEVAETDNSGTEGTKVDTTSGAAVAGPDETTEAVASAEGMETTGGKMAAIARAVPKVEKPRITPKLTCSLAYDID